MPRQLLLARCLLRVGRRAEGLEALARAASAEWPAADPTSANGGGGGGAIGGANGGGGGGGEEGEEGALADAEELPAAEGGGDAEGGDGCADDAWSRAAGGPMLRAAKAAERRQAAAKDQ
eukprot:4145528-Prymnesium_polylepis.1